MVNNPVDPLLDADLSGWESGSEITDTGQYGEEGEQFGIDWIVRAQWFPAPSNKNDFWKTNRRGLWRYRVKWTHYKQKSNSWEPAANFSTEKTIKDFWAKLGLPTEPEAFSPCSQNGEVVICADKYQTEPRLLAEWVAEARSARDEARQKRRQKEEKKKRKKKSSAGSSPPKKRARSSSNKPSYSDSEDDDVPLKTQKKRKKLSLPRVTSRSLSPAPQLEAVVQDQSAAPTISNPFGSGLPKKAASPPNAKDPHGDGTPEREQTLAEQKKHKSKEVPRGDKAERPEKNEKRKITIGFKLKAIIKIEPPEPTLGDLASTSTPNATTASPILSPADQQSTSALPLPSPSVTDAPIPSSSTASSAGGALPPKVLATDRPLPTKSKAPDATAPSSVHNKGSAKARKGTLLGGRLVVPPPPAPSSNVSNSNSPTPQTDPSVYPQRLHTSATSHGDSATDDHSISHASGSSLPKVSQSPFPVGNIVASTPNPIPAPVASSFKKSSTMKFMKKTGTKFKMMIGSAFGDAETLGTMRLTDLTHAAFGKLDLKTYFPSTEDDSQPAPMLFFDKQYSQHVASCFLKSADQIIQKGRLDVLEKEGGKSDHNLKEFSRFLDEGQVGGVISVAVVDHTTVAVVFNRSSPHCKTVEVPSNLQDGTGLVFVLLEMTSFLNPPAPPASDDKPGSIGDPIGDELHKHIYVNPRLPLNPFLAASEVPNSFFHEVKDKTVVFFGRESSLKLYHMLVLTRTTSRLGARVSFMNAPPPISSPPPPAPHIFVFLNSDIEDVISSPVFRHWKHTAPLLQCYAVGPGMEENLPPSKWPFRSVFPSDKVIVAFTPSALLGNEATEVYKTILPTLNKRRDWLGTVHPATFSYVCKKKGIDQLTNPASAYWTDRILDTSFGLDATERAIYSAPVNHPLALNVCPPSSASSTAQDMYVWKDMMISLLAARSSEKSRNSEKLLKISARALSGLGLGEELLKDQEQVEEVLVQDMRRCLMNPTLIEDFRRFIVVGPISDRVKALEGFGGIEFMNIKEFTENLINGSAYRSGLNVQFKRYDHFFAKQ